MQVRSGSILLSATDVSNFLACRRRSALDLALIHGLVKAPTWVDPMAAVLRDRGNAHEQQYLGRLKDNGRTIVDLRDDPCATNRTLEAMRDGADVIYQAKFEQGQWLGYVDFLQRIEEPSELGPWSYEVYDTKLARETKAGTILQLAVYSELVGAVQGRRPEYFYVVTPDPLTPLHRYRLADFDAYHRLVRGQLEVEIAEGAEHLLENTYPEPVEHCEVCRWFQECEVQRRKDDHLAYVAGISRVQRSELQAQGIGTLTELAQMAVPLTFKPSRGAKATYERLQDQARLQLRGRRTGKPEFALLLPPDPKQGLSRLPEPSAGDLFLDLEGDPFAREGGREYLFGLGRVGADGTFAYDRFWAFDDEQEQKAFESVVDAITRACDRDPSTHVYHFGHYEPSALKRLMGRYVTREDAIDALLRSERFVDLHVAVRHALRAGIESYSIKQLEMFYAFERNVPLDDAAPHRRTLEVALETHAIDAIGDDVKQAVEGYNRDDCRSTLALRNWLESLRSQVINDGTPIPRPTAQSAEAPPRVSELQARVDQLRAKLLEDVAVDPMHRTKDHQTRWLLAYLLDWHRREDKVAWWEYYRLRDLPEEELYDEPHAVAGLTFVQRVGEVRNKKTGKPTGTVIDRYSFPPQEIEIREDDELKGTDGKKFAEVIAVDRYQRTIDLKKGRALADSHPSALYAHTHFSPDTMQKALLRLAESVTTGAATLSAGLDLLYRRSPRLTSGQFAPYHHESVLDFAIRCGLSLDSSAFAIQGPPGSGKTYTAAQMICALVTAGKRVGVTAVSHKVIRKLLDDFRCEATKRGLDITCGHKTRPRDDDPPDLQVVDDNREALALLSEGQVNVLGATAWLWGREDAEHSVDVLFVDEAGQMSLANVLAASQAAKSLVLLGDPQQLEQPQKGSHPDGVDISALEHVLGGAKTMPADRGLFLPITWRLAPSICDFTSEVFYEGRLTPKPGLENQVLCGAGVFEGAGLWWVPVEHERNQNWSIQEIEVVDRIVSALIGSASDWVDEHGAKKLLTSGDVLVVAPYNAQVTRLFERLAPKGVRVGTVDKFQGQEAPVVIYSMTSSSLADAPRGLEFLYSLNRLNVATSRARCAVILVASPRLFEPECRTPRQMQLANALCRYRELARTVSV